MNTSEIMSAMIFGDGGASKVEELSTDGGSTDAGKVLVVGDNGKIAASDLTVGEGEIALDKTLSVNGAAADAKKVGDALSAVNGSLGTLIDVVPTDTASGTIVSFNDGADDIPVKNLTVNIEPIQDLHGYARPWVAGGGKNLFNKNSFLSYKGYFDNNTKKVVSSATHTIVYMPCEPDTYYTASRLKMVSNERFALGYASVPPSNGSNIIGMTAVEAPAGAVGSVIKKTVKTSEDATYLLVWAWWDSSVNAKDSLQIEIGSTATDYEPYENICPISGWTGANLTCNNETINIDWTNEAGTVYGGSLDVTTGVLVVTHGVKSFNGGFNKHGSVPNAYYINNAFSDCGEGVPLCNMFLHANKTFNNLSKGQFNIDTNYTRLCFRSSAFSDATEANAFFAENPLIVAYPLATPVTYQLTPNEVKTILGENNIFADTGDVSVEYRADIKKYIDKVVATAVSALS